MRLTKQTNYAIRILMYCAANDGKLSRIQDIAKSYGVSDTFLFKILQSLVAARFVMTTRGRNGGIQLAKPAADISLLDVVAVTEDGFIMAECFDADFDECPLINACSLNAALREALDAFMNVLASHSIESLTSDRRKISQLLGIAIEAQEFQISKP